jgi:hypothetical protein
MEHIAVKRGVAVFDMKTKARVTGKRAYFHHFALVAAVCSTSFAGAASAPPLLFRLEGPCRSESVVAQTSACRRVTYVPSATGNPPLLFRLQLPDRERFYDVDLRGGKSVPVSANGNFMWILTLPGEGIGYLSQFGGGILGLFPLPEGVYRLRLSEVGEQIVERLNPSQFLTDDSADSPADCSCNANSQEEQCNSNSQEEQCNDTADEIRVLAVYTPQAIAAAANENQLLVGIDSAIAVTNYSFSKSHIAAKLVRIGGGRIEHSEMGFGIDWALLKGDHDGFMDSIHQWRDKEKADIVLLVTSEPIAAGKSSQLQCSYLNRPEEFGRFSFALVPWNSLTGPRYAFSHEIGHLMGASHDPKSGGAPGVELFSHGHAQPTTASQSNCAPWITIMGTTDYCIGCETRLLWSSPDQHMCGVQAGSKDENNAETLRRTAATVAKFRCSHPATF